MMEMILMVGIPGSGKTTLAEIAFPEHTCISLDQIKDFSSRQKCTILTRHAGASCCADLSPDRQIECALVHDALTSRKNIVVDDTNLTRAIRKRHIAAAQEHGAMVRAVHFINILQAFKYNAGRQYGLDGSVLGKCRNEMEPPSKDEGLDFIQTMYL